MAVLALFNGENGKWRMENGLGTHSVAAKVSAKVENLPEPISHFPFSISALDSGLTVYLVTMGQGEQLWEKFGHNALLFRSPARGIDLAYNWGVFSFDQPHFVQRFLTGDTKYWVEAAPGEWFINAYRSLDRTIDVQRLNLTPAQAQKAFEFAMWNAREENKYYRYDYFADNCSTRVRDVIDLALGGALKSATSATIVRNTYRGESLRLVDDLKLTQLGMDVALGEPADKPLSVWETMFIPMKMRDVLRDLRVNGVPVVAREQRISETTRYQERATPPRLILPYLLLGLWIAGMIAVTWRLSLTRRTARIIFRVEAVTWAIVTGLLGVIVLLAWTTTRHVFWYRNENLLLVSPLALFLAALLMRSAEPWRRRAAIVATVIALMGALALVLKGLPWFTQDNAAIALLFLPPHFALAYALMRGTPRTADRVA